MAVVGAFDYSQMPAKKEVQFAFQENRTGELKKEGLGNEWKILLKIFFIIIVVVTTTHLDLESLV